MVREPLVTKLAGVAEVSPSAAVLAAYSDIEQALKRRLREAQVPGIEKTAGAQLVDVAPRTGVINHRTAVAIRRVLALRNLAAHGGDVESAKALEYLSLVDAVLHAIEGRNWETRGGDRIHTGYPRPAVSNRCPQVPASSEVLVGSG